MNGQRGVIGQWVERKGLVIIIITSTTTTTTTTIIIIIVVVVVVVVVVCLFLCITHYALCSMYDLLCICVRIGRFEVKMSNGSVINVTPAHLINVTELILTLG